MWVGVPFREATDSDAVRPIEDDNLEDSDDEETADDVKGSEKTMSNKGLLAKYRKMMEEGGKVQLKVFEIADFTEKVINFSSWKNPLITTLILWGVLAAIALAVFVPQRIILW